MSWKLKNSLMATFHFYFVTFPPFPISFAYKFSLNKHLFITKIYFLSSFHHFSIIILLSPPSLHTSVFIFCTHCQSNRLICVLCVWSQWPSRVGLLSPTIWGRVWRRGRWQSGGKLLIFHFSLWSGNWEPFLFSPHSSYTPL